MDIFEEIKMIGEIVENDAEMLKGFEEYIKAGKEGRLMEKLNEGRKPIEVDYSIFNK